MYTFWLGVVSVFLGQYLYFLNFYGIPRVYRFSAVSMEHNEHNAPSGTF